MASKWLGAGRMFSLPLFCVALGVAASAHAEEEHLLRDLRAQLISYEWTVQAFENDAELCPNLVRKLLWKLDRSVSKDEKENLRIYLKTAKRCSTKLTQVARAGAQLHRNCSVVADELERVDDAPHGSDAARRAPRTRGAAKVCLTKFATWNSQLDELRALLERVEEIAEAT